MRSSAVARETFCALRREIARIEGRLAERLETPPRGPAANVAGAVSMGGAVLRRHGAAEVEAARIVTGVERFDAGLGGGLPKAALSEFHGAESRNAGAVAGFALALLALLLGGLRHAEPVLWISLRDFFREAGRPYAPGLAQRFGILPGQLLFAGAAKLEDALWLTEEAAALGRLAAVILELPDNPSKLDLTATRRLHRRAVLAGRPVFLLRQSALAEPTAAPIRLAVGPAPAAPRKILSGALNGSIGPPAFSVSLSKSPLARHDEFILEWNSDGFLHERSRQSATDRRTADHGAMVPQPRRATGAAPEAGALLAFEPAAAAAAGGQLARRQHAEDLRAG